MKPVMSGIGQTILIKGVLPLALIILCAVLFKLAGAQDNKFANVLVTIGIVAYTLVNLWHIFNFVLLFFTI